MRGSPLSTAGHRARARRLGSVFACCFALGLTALPAAAQARLPNGFFGIDTVLSPSAGEFAQIANNGGESFRIAVIWRNVERQPPVVVAGQPLHSYDFSATDAEMRRMVSAGLQPHVSLIGSPSWVAKSFATTPMRSKAGRQNWPAFVAAVVARYGPGGSFWAANPGLPPIPPDVYQVWNEQNSQIAYAPAADPAEYAKLFNLAGAQIRKRDPRATILPGGMFGTPQLPKSLYAWPFLRKFLAAPGVGKYVGGIAVHPYAKALRGLKYQVRKMRKTAHAAGFGSLPLYITEIGWSSEQPNGNIFYKGIEGQAKAIDRALGLLVRKQETWNLERVLWFTWSDVTEHEADVSGCGFCQKMGLVDRNLRPKPALRSWQRYALP
jgi:hypothetical protein